MKKCIPKYALLIFMYLLISCGDKNGIVESDVPAITAEWKDWIVKNSYEIKIDNNDGNKNFSFLKPLLATKRIVQLGESSHGVKEYNLIKVALIKYLHEELGYNVIAFESSIYDCFFNFNYGLANGAVASINNSLFKAWRTNEIVDLFNYIIKTQNSSNPLILAGIDIQPIVDGNKSRPTFIKEVFDKIDTKIASDFYMFDDYFLSINFKDPNKSNFNFILDKKDYLVTEYEKYLSVLENNWGKLTMSYGNNSPIPHIAKLAIRSSIKFVNEICYNNKFMSKEFVEERDSNMAYNLDYLLKNLYGDKKVIVWAHNFHVSYNSQNIESPLYGGAVSMGSVIKHNYADDIYTIGFYTYKGQVADGFRNPTNVTSSTSENIEAILYYTNYVYAFVDMKYQQLVSGNSWMFNKMKTKAYGVIDEKMVIKDQYDALIYVYESHLPDYY
jgi:erythromycin esterase